MNKENNFFKKGNKIENSLISTLSPSNKYRLEIYQYKTREGGWNYSLGNIYEIQSEKLIASIYRNYPAFPYCWVNQNNKEYLIGGENYQGQTVVDLQTGDTKSFMSEGYEKGHGFCFGSMNPSPDGNLLAVEGCYWGAPWQIKIFDITNILEGPKEIPIENYESEGFWWFDAKIEKWINNNTIEISTTRDLITYFNKYEDELTDEEYEECIKDKNKSKQVTVKFKKIIKI